MIEEKKEDLLLAVLVSQRSVLKVFLFLTQEKLEVLTGDYNDLKLVVTKTCCGLLDDFHET